MAGAIVSTISALLKDVYLPPVVEQLNNEVLLLSRLERVNNPDILGNQVVVPLHKGRTGGIGSRAELIALPTSGNQVFARAVYDFVSHYGRIQVSGQSVAKAKNNTGSFLETLKAEMDGVRNDLKKDQARQVYGASDGNTGGNGRIAQCGTTTASNVIVLNSDEALRKGHLYVGMRVDIGTAGSPTSLINGEAITAVSVTNKTITVTTAVTTSSSHFVCRAGNAGNELNGLQSIVSTTATSLGGIDASQAGNEYWDNLRDTAGGSLTLDNMQKMWNRIRINGGDVSLILTTFGMQRAYYGLLQSLTRYVDTIQDLKAGYRSLAFNDKPLVADVDAKFGSLFFLDESHLKNFVNEDWHWLQEDGDVLKWVVGFDAWEAAMAKYNQLGADRRNVFGVMSGLATSDPNGF